MPPATKKRSEPRSFEGLRVKGRWGHSKLRKWNVAIGEDCRTASAPVVASRHAQTAGLTPQAS